MSFASPRHSSRSVVKHFSDDSTAERSRRTNGSGERVTRTSNIAACRLGRAGLVKYRRPFGWPIVRPTGEVMPHLRFLLKDCNALMGQFDAIHLSKFINDTRSTSVVATLVRGFPKGDNLATSRIMNFVERACELGFHNPKGRMLPAGAALLASVLLTSLEPARFVDYRHNRWSEMAELLGYELRESDYGRRIVEAGHFAQAVCRTKTFKHFWPDQEPLWALSGICWMKSQPEKPKVIPPEFPEPEPELYIEGRKRKVMLETRQRNQKVVKLAKERAWQRDNTLPCEACGFSFAETYGPVGERLIEAHHRRPIATVKGGHLTKVEDIALVCANCHRMLHRGGESITVEALREILRK